jgi:3-hydroxybutyryl-CoA dehydrogenase
MKLAVIANEEFKHEFLAIPPQQGVELSWFAGLSDLQKNGAENGIIDLLFSGTEKEINILKDFLPRPVIVHSVCHTLQEIKQPFVRLNGWPGFLRREIAEISVSNQTQKEEVEKIFSSLGRKTEFVPDIPGFISARVIAMIINEAYFALEEQVSTRQEIDTAMKLGTGYPYGPFEWAGKIGIKNICSLLQILSGKEKRYQPAAWLQKEATGINNGADFKY